jgi:hypothetical protein
MFVLNHHTAFQIYLGLTWPPRESLQVEQDCFWVPGTGLDLSQKLKIDENISEK